MGLKVYRYEDDMGREVTVQFTDEQAAARGFTDKHVVKGEAAGSPEPANQEFAPTDASVYGQGGVTITDEADTKKAAAPANKARTAAAPKTPKG